MLQQGPWSKGVLPRRELGGNLAGWVEISGKEKEVGMIKPEVFKREEVWCKLKELKLLAHQRRLCIGDFNQILFVKEKFSFGDGPIPGAENFQLLVLDLQLCDLVAQGQQFTWMNERDEENFVMERLDRAFASVEWIETYPNYALTNHPIIRSDHGPITLDFELKLPFQRRPFSVRKEFVHWNRKVFGRIEQEINQKKRLLQDLQNNVIFMEDVGQERELRDELECLLKREELM
uniref:Reverse transcriptase n=1 Tax=Quercus lobata TaxID=97700 RepID=A0A7N2N230_QUELO